MSATLRGVTPVWYVTHHCEKSSQGEHMPQSAKALPLDRQSACCVSTPLPLPSASQQHRCSPSLPRYQSQLP